MYIAIRQLQLKLCPIRIVFTFFFCFTVIFLKAQNCTNNNGPELVTNGGFDAEFNGFNSQYRTTPYRLSIFLPIITIREAGHIQVVADASIVNGTLVPDFAGAGHGGAGSFLMVNGSTLPNARVLCTRVNNVVPNSNYFFSVWISTISWGSLPNRMAKLRFSINGNQIGTTINAPGSVGQWAQFFVPWNSGGATFADICLVNENTTPGGNDFGIDDISFTTSCQGLSKTGPQPNLGPDIAICNSGNTITLNPSVPSAPNLRYIWSNGATTPTIDVNAAGKYVVCIDSAGYGCYKSDTILITPADIPAPVVADLAYCQNAIALPLAIAPPTNYVVRWYEGASGGVGSADTPLINTQIAGTNSYYLSYLQDAATGNCESARVPLKVTIHAPPNLSLPASYKVCLKDTLEIGIPPEASYSYQWTTDAPISNASASLIKVSYTDAPAVPTHPFSLTVTDNNTGCKSEPQTSVNVMPIPAIPNLPETYSTCSGKSITIGMPQIAGYSYKWFPTDGLTSIENSLTNILLYSTSPTSQERIYKLTVQDVVSGCQNQAATKIVVQPGPISSLPESYEVCANLSVRIGQAPAPGNSYRWLTTEGINEPGASFTDFSPTITQKVAGRAMLQTVITDIISGCQTIDTTEVLVNALPASGLQKAFTICADDTIGVGQAPAAGITYQWRSIAGLLDADKAITRFTFANTGNTPLTIGLHLTLENQTTRCVNKDSTFITIHPSPIVALPAAYNVCAGDSIVIGVSAVTGFTYQWRNPTGLQNAGLSTTMLAISESDSFPKAYTYSLEVKSINGSCSAEDSTIVTVLPKPKIEVAALSLCKSDQFVLLEGLPTGGTFVGANISQNRYTPSAAGSYSYSYNYVNNYGCAATASQTITVHDKPIINFAPVPTLCTNSPASITLEATPQGGVFKGLFVEGNKFVGKESGEFRIWYVATDLYQCTDSSSQLINVFNPTPIRFELPDTVCLGYPPIPLQGFPSGGTYFGAVSTSNTFTPNISGPNQLYYSFTDTNNCTDTAIQSVFVKPFMQIPVQLGADVSLCKGDSLRIAASENGTYLWEPMLSTVRNIIVSPVITTSFKLTITDSVRCGLGSDSVVVAIVDPPKNPLRDDTLIACLTSESLVIRPQAGDQFYWEPTNTLDSLLEVTASGTYILTASHAGVCPTKDTITVLELCEPSVYIPEAFSPNNDGTNEQLKIYGKFIHNLAFTIHNRWGEIIYQSHLLGAGWDGLYCGQPMPAGVYPWTIKYSSLKDRSIIIRQGSITLVR